ncbi:hypothetical protein GALMADRAFT_254229 [Galerina marginata CBS 339.88]|uniref:Methylated-DNA--protein-cysteine methyltransferase n=1 Tax=Galerina marginata (strain CBS 339.88) TaxID=685588 RepID=A0A067STP5_GALM3|nr:hypothetical protein GALMADRAFT_254229 [Galerina marginata CBS 339.88]
MPVQRTKSNKVCETIKTPTEKSAVDPEQFALDSLQDIKVQTPIELEAACNMTQDTHHYPSAVQERDVYRTKTGKKLTAHQWAVYDFTRTIPRGKVATYKEVSSAVGGSPRSVGSALRNNPFSPYIPCHRVIASNLFIGGFFGEWGKNHKTGTRYNEKVDMLIQEGVHFDDSGHLLSADEILWKP